MPVCGWLWFYIIIQDRLRFKWIELMIKKNVSRNFYHKGSVKFISKDENFLWKKKNYPV